MAQRITLIDDIDHATGLESEAVDTVVFSFKTKNTARREYAVDVNEIHLAEFEAELTRWATYGRKVDKAPPVVSRPAPAAPKKPVEAKPKTSPPLPPTPAPTADTIPEWSTPSHAPHWQRPHWTDMRKDARAWALRNGWPHLGDRGRVPDAAYPAWKQAMGWTGPLFEEWSAWRETPPPDPPPKSRNARKFPGRVSQDTLL